MGLYIPVHDSHAVRVIQSLQNKKKPAFSRALHRAGNRTLSIRTCLPLEVQTSRSEYQNRLISGRDPINKNIRYVLNKQCNSKTTVFTTDAIIQIPFGKK